MEPQIIAVKSLAKNSEGWQESNRGGQGPYRTLSIPWNQQEIGRAKFTGKSCKQRLTIQEHPVFREGEVFIYPVRNQYSWISYCADTVLDAEVAVWVRQMWFQSFELFSVIEQTTVQMMPSMPWVRLARGVSRVRQSGLLLWWQLPISQKNKRGLVCASGW